MFTHPYLAEVMAEQRIAELRRTARGRASWPSPAGLFARLAPAGLWRARSSQPTGPSCMPCPTC